MGDIVKVVIPGPPGPSFNGCGEYDDSRSYSRYDTVDLDGVSYWLKARGPVQGKTPPDNLDLWQLLAGLTPDVRGAVEAAATAATSAMASSDTATSAATAAAEAAAAAAADHAAAAEAVAGVPMLIPSLDAEISFRRYLTASQWSTILSGEYDGQSTDHLSVEWQNAEDEVSARGGGTIRYPAGVIPVDGRKGALSNYSSSVRGALSIKGGVHHKGVPGFKTIFKNVADEWRSIMSIRQGVGTVLEDIVLDGDFENHPTVDVTVDSVRGEALLLWSTISPIERFRVKNVMVRNTGHYGVGIQNIEVFDLWVDGLYAKDTGGDGIDIKHYPEGTNKHKQLIRITNSVADAIGKNWPARVTDGPQAGFDIRGWDTVVSNCEVRNLDTYDETQVGNTGFRVSPPIDNDSSRKGGKRAILVGNRTISSKDVLKGKQTSGRIIGLHVTDEQAVVTGHENYNCYEGTVVESWGDGPADGATLLGIVNVGCYGAAGDGKGLAIRNSTVGHSVDVLNIDCDISTTLLCYDSNGTIRSRGCTTITSAVAAVLCKNSFHFVTEDLADPDSIAGHRAMFQGSAGVVAAQTPVFTLRSAKDGGRDSPYELGVIQVAKTDETTGLPVIVGRISARATGPSVTSIGFDVETLNIDGSVYKTFSFGRGTSETYHKTEPKFDVYAISSNPSDWSSPYEIGAFRSWCKATGTDLDAGGLSIRATGSSMTSFKDVLWVRSNTTKTDVLELSSTVAKFNVNARFPVNVSEITPNKTGTIGDFYMSTTALYVCTATNTWIKIPGVTSW